MLYGRTKAFRGYVCESNACSDDAVYPYPASCNACKKPLVEVELWRDDDYQELWELMA